MNQSTELNRWVMKLKYFSASDNNYIIDFLLVNDYKPRWMQSRLIFLFDAAFTSKATYVYKSVRKNFADNSVSCLALDYEKPLYLILYTNVNKKVLCLKIYMEET